MPVRGIGNTACHAKAGNRPWLSDSVQCLRHPIRPKDNIVIMKIRNIIPVILALVPLAQSVAQVDTTKASYNESVYVQGDFKPVIEQSFKLNVNPTVVDTVEPMKHTFGYSITPQRVTSVFSPARLGYVKITEPPQRLYNNYLRLGFGNYWTPMADLYYHSTRSKNLNYGARLFHQSSWGRIGKEADTVSPAYYGPNHFSATDLSLFGKYILKENVQFSSDLDYSHDNTMFYGFSDSTLNAHCGTAAVPFTHDSVSPSLYGMVYNFLGWKAGAKSLNTDVNKLGYEANLGLNNLWGRYGMSELNLNLAAAAHYGFPLLKEHKGIAYLRFVWQGYSFHYNPQYADDGTLSLPYYNTVATADTVEHTRNIVSVNPYLDFIFKRFQVHAGVMPAWDGFSGPDVRFHLFPDVIVSTSFMDDALNISLGFVGGIEANSWNAIRLVNPYVMWNATPLVSPYAMPAVREVATKHWDTYAHMRLTFSKKLELNVRGQLNILTEDLLFRPNRSQYPLGNVFETYYGNYIRATIGADLTFVNDEMLSAELGGNIYGYKHHVENYPLLYLPKFDVHLTANVNYKDKVIAHLQTLLIGPMAGDCVYDNTTPSFYAVSDTLPMRIGLALEVEYLHTRALSFFVRFDNILCQRYFYWSNYPSQRLSAMLGITYTIPTKKH